MKQNDHKIGETRISLGRLAALKRDPSSMRGVLHFEVKDTRSRHCRSATHVASQQYRSKQNMRL